jgi:hypothetical protein
MPICTLRLNATSYKLAICRTVSPSKIALRPPELAACYGRISRSWSVSQLVFASERVPCPRPWTASMASCDHSAMLRPTRCPGARCIMSRVTPHDHAPVIYQVTDERECGGSVQAWSVSQDARRPHGHIVGSRVRPREPYLPPYRPESTRATVGARPGIRLDHRESRGPLRCTQRAPEGCHTVTFQIADTL